MMKRIEKEGSCESQLSDSRDGANAPASPPHAVGSLDPQKLFIKSVTIRFGQSPSSNGYGLKKSKVKRIWKNIDEYGTDAWIEWCLGIWYNGIII